MQAHCPFCALLTDPLYISYILVFRWVPGLISDQSIWDLWRKKWQWGRILSKYFGFLPQDHSTEAQSLSSYYYFYNKDKRTKPINFTQSKAICDMGQSGQEKILITFLFFKGLRGGASSKTLHGRRRWTWGIINRRVMGRLFECAKPTENLPCPGYEPVAGSFNTVIQLRFL